jgi:uncharacterized protein (DUF697 family)
MIEEERKRKAHLIIHGASTASAGAAAILAQRILLLGVEAPVIATITTGMVVSLGKLFDQAIEKPEAETLIDKYKDLGLSIVGAKTLLGFIPVIGNVANATITFGCTEALGWWAYNHFEARHKSRPSRRSSGTWRVSIS